MVRRAVLWTFTTQLVNFAIQFGSSVLLARLLSPRELGVFAVALAITGIVQLFASFGVANYVIREEHLTPETLQTAFTINAVLSGMLSVLIFASSFVSGVFLRDDGVAQVLRWISITPILGIPAFQPTVMLQRTMQLRGVSIIGTLNVVLVSSITIASAWYGASYMSPAYGTVSGAVFSALATLAIGRKHIGFRLSVREWRPMTAFGLRLMSIGGISGAAARVSDIILGHFLGLTALGLYSRATNLNNILFTNVYGSATRVIFAKLSEAKRDGDRVADVYMRGYRIIVAVMAPLLLGLAVLSGPAVHLLYGNRWLGVAMPLALLLIGQMISLTFAMNWELFVIRDELKTQTRLEITRSIIGLTTQLIGSMFSLIVVSATVIVDNILSLLLYQKHMPRLARTAPSVFYKAYGEGAWLAIISAIPGFCLMVDYGWDPNTPLLLVFASVGLGIVFWLASVIATQHPILHEIDIALSKITGNRLRLQRQNAA